MFVRKKTYQVVRDALTLAESVIGKQQEEVAERDGRITRLEGALGLYRQKLKDALEKLGDEPPEPDLSLIFSE